MATVTNPRVALLNQGYSLTWSDGTLFTGFWLVELITASSNTGPWPSTSVGNTLTQLPQFSILPITQGVFNGSVGLYFNSDLTPPGTQYRAWLYDSTNTLVGSAGLPVVFTVSSNPFTPAISAPIVPSTLAPTFAPDSGPQGLTVTLLTSGLVAVPTVQTAVTTTATVVYQIVISNTTSASIDFRALDGVTGFQFCPDIPIDAKSETIMSYGAGLSVASLSWLAGATGLVAQISGVRS